MTPGGAARPGGGTGPGEAGPGGGAPHGGTNPSSKRAPDDGAGGRAGVRRLSAVAGVVLAIEAVALIVVLQVHGGTSRLGLLPVTASLSGEGGRASGDPLRVVLAQIDLGAAVVVLVTFVAVVRLLAALPPRVRLARWISPGPATGHRTARWIEYSFTASVTVFLVAQLNGVADVAALVLSYAATSGMVLFTVLQERSSVRAGHPRLALCFGAAVGIVPWGIIAFQQIGAGVVGDPPSALVRVITLVMLAFALAFALTQWRELGALRVAVGSIPAASRESRPGDTLRGAGMHVLLSLASTSAFAWLVVLGVALPT